MSKALTLSFLLLFVGVATAADEDLDNNGILADEPVYTPIPYEGPTDGTAIVYFPTTADTWEVSSYPYWWHEGDTVYGVHDPGLAMVNHVDCVIKISYNVLNNGGHVDLDFRIDGTTVGSMVLTEAHGTGLVMASFDFSPISPPFELRYYETNLVAPGGGSVSLDDTGECFVTFSGPVPTISETWGGVKLLFR
jgi:hypothetical protein